MTATPHASLTATDLAMFERLGITPEVLAEAGVPRVIDAESRRDYGIRAPAQADAETVAAHRKTAQK